MLESIPVIDIAPLLSKDADKISVVKQIGAACRNHGFFYITGHGVDRGLQQRLDDLSKAFFAQDEQVKMKISMEKGERAWRGYFPVGGELTSGKADFKEGVYFGLELEAEHPLVKAGLPLHGPNLFPDIKGFRETILTYMDVMTHLGHRLMEGLALSLGLKAQYFADRYTADPLILFRIFHYPSSSLIAAPAEDSWGVAEHTDYGLLTILRQDSTGGLQVKTGNKWIEAQPIADTFICNIGDMLDRMTGGLYRSTPHRVKNTTSQNRLSFPFFFDPNFQVEVQPIERVRQPIDDQQQRWDKASVHAFKGTYGEYLLGKVGKVFPALKESKLKSDA